MKKLQNNNSHKIQNENKINFIIIVFGFISGFSLLTTGNTLNFWLTKELVNKETIGLFSLIAIPYSINFLWAPIFDRAKIPYLHNKLGMRLSWLLVLSLFLGISIFILSMFSPKEDLFWVCVTSIFVSFFSTSKDSVLGAIRSEILSQKQLISTSGSYILGYRIGMLVASSGAIFVSSFMSWNDVYKIFSLFIFLFCVLIFFIKNKMPTYETQEKMNLEINSNVILSIGNQNSYKFFFTICLFLILYRIGDNYISAMINPFLLEKGFDEVEISLYNKLLSGICSILGSVFASQFAKNISITKGLFYTGIVHLLSHFSLIAQSLYDKSITLMVLGVLIENLTGGACMTFYIAYIAHLCSGKYRATQYSILSSFMGLSRLIFPVTSGFIVANYGWTNFFIICFIITIPSIFLINYVNKKHG